MKFRTMISAFHFPLLNIFPCILLLSLLALSAPGFAQPTLDAEEQAFLKLINDYRSANGLGTLQASAALTNSSKWMSNDMASKGYFSHTDSTGRDAFTRMRNFGYTYNTWLGENIAAGYSDAVSTFNQWKNSPAHNENMLNPNFNVLGIGRVANLSAYYRYYWTTDFGGFVDTVISPGMVPVVATVSAANYVANVAPDSIVALFGSNLANSTYFAPSIPLPTTLGGTTVSVNGIQASLLYVSPTQINYILPSSVGEGTATVEVKVGGTLVGKGTATVVNVAPALFTITSDGKGVPAGYSTFDNITLKALNNPDGTTRPLDAGTTLKPDYVVLFGTGFRKRSSLNNVQVFVGGVLAPIDYAGSQNGFVGLDQLNIKVPPTTRGSGETNLIFVVDGKQANTVRVNIGN